MAYTKPGVEVKQEQRSATPILIAPDLESCIVGTGYHWQDPTWDDPNNANLNSIYSAAYTGDELVIPASGINSNYNELVDGSAVVDLMITQGSEAGKLKHLLPGDEFSVSGNNITISGSLTGISSAQVRVGFLAENSNVEGAFTKIESVTDISDVVGEPVSWNPLAYGALLAIENSGRSTNVYGIGDVTSAADARSALENEEIYSIATLESAPSVTA